MGLRAWSRVVISAALVAALIGGCSRTFSPEVIAGARCATLLIAADGRSHLFYVDAATKRVMHRSVDDASATPVSPAGDAIDLRGENAPPAGWLPNGTLLVAYPVTIATTNGKHASELRVQRSGDGGRTWSEPHRIDGDDAARSHNFADLAVTRSGDGIVSWLDSRAGQQGVQTTVLRDDAPQRATLTVDAKTCQCCRTALHVGADGTVWLAYRDLAEGKVRNIAYAVSGDGGRSFVVKGDVVDDRWSVDGCPEAGPRFTETSDGTSWVVWLNGGAKAIEVASSQGQRLVAKGVVAAADATTAALDHPDVGTLPDGRLVVVYEALRGGVRAIDARISDAAHAHWSAPIALVSAGSNPRYARAGERALLAFATLDRGVSQIHVIDPLPRLLAR